MFPEKKQLLSIRCPHASPPPCILSPTAWQCNHGPGQRFMGASLITTSTAWPLWVPQRHHLFQPSPTSASGTGWLSPHRPPSSLTKHTQRIHPPMLTCSDAPVMSCRSKGHAWAVMVDWSSDITALFGDHSKTCLSPCQSFLKAKRLSNHMSRCHYFAFDSFNW